MAGTNQALEFVGRVLTQVPWGSIDKKKLQGLIDDSDRVAKELVRFINNGGKLVVAVDKKIINLDADPFVPEDWEVRSDDQINSRVRGSIAFDPDKIELHLNSGQQDGQSIQGHDLRKALEGQPVLPAHVLDFLLENAHLIPESWKNKAMFFWGTIYRYSDGFLCVRCLCWNGRRWRWGYSWLDHRWYSNNPAALLAS